VGLDFVAKTPDGHPGASDAQRCLSTVLVGKCG